VPRGVEGRSFPARGDRAPTVSSLAYLEKAGVWRTAGEEWGEKPERGEGDLAAVAPAVREIIAGTRRGGAAAVRGYVEAFERRKVPQLVREAFDGSGA